nr:MAG TPA: hypothetical protein [Crassvirales sp.]
MEENKILEILKKVPLGTELYSPAFGEMKFSGIRDCFGNEQRIAALTESKIDMAFLTNGKFRKSGEIMLFPSNFMREWDKFAWKEGDVLVSNEGDCCIFTEFLGYPYTTFLAKLVLCNETVKSGTLVEETRCWEKASNKTTEEYIEYINTKLKESNHRVNSETLEVEPIKSTFKRDSPIYKKVSDKPEHEFQPFERVLVRDQKTDKWTVNLYGSKRKVGHYNYVLVGGLSVYCIPYEGNEHLLDTTNNPD